MQQPAVLTIYNTSGAIVARTRVTGSGMLPWQLPHGIYIARLADRTFTLAL